MHRIIIDPAQTKSKAKNLIGDNKFVGPTRFSEPKNVNEVTSQPNWFRAVEKEYEALIINT